MDPYFDVFRLLDPRETPPSTGQVFGEPRVTAVLPSKAAPDLPAGYRALLAGWQSGSHAIEVRLDSEIAQLPADRSVWLLGADNRFAREVFARQAGLGLSADGFVVDGKVVPRTSSTVLMTRHPASMEKAIGWIVTETASPLPAIGRKLPHYGKYSYLAFEGTDAVNKLAGQWQDVDSPLRLDLRKDRTAALPALPPDPAKALAQLPPAR